MTAKEGRREGAAGSAGKHGPAVGGTGPAGFVPLDQAFDAGSLYALRAAVAAHAAAAGLGKTRVYDVTAVAHELAANAVTHGAGHGRLRLWADGGFLYCQVSDDGRDERAETAGQAAPAASRSSAPSGSTPAPWPAEHGHGLWLVRQVAEHVSIGHGPSGTTATVRFPLMP
jgi:anti-sigma regulatory factor (Ser/Thr protein kinase)